MATRAEQMEARIAAAAKEMNADDARAAKSREKWEDLCLNAFEEYDITYDRIGVLSKKSRARIDQVLRKVRLRRGIHVNSQN